MRRTSFFVAMSVVGGLAPSAAFAADVAPHLDGAGLTLMWALPFAGILLSIAVLPLLAPNLWHRHFGKISALWALGFIVPCAVVFGPGLTGFEILHVALLDYVPFIILLLALYTVSGGVRIKGDLVGTPGVNTAMLAFGTAIASWMGTTGAAMLLIRPVIQANLWRRHNVHVIVFFIFLVANIGGSLTPLGDPPLFLGFLKGVSFFWPMEHLFFPMLVMAVPLLAVFYGLDWLLFRREMKRPPEPKGERLAIEGWSNVVLLGAIVASVLLSGVWRPGVAFDIYHVSVSLQEIARNVLLLGIVWLSWRLTGSDARAANGFSWFPMVEVAKLFAGIFVTIIPALAILRAGTDGALGPLVGSVSGSDGQPVNAAYFWLTGILSSFLDNAPTYLIFFNLASGDAAELTGSLTATLVAISAGAVFMGANTYIGNAPNFMVRAIAEQRGIRMPSFFGYMVWSAVVLGPLFILVTLVFF